MGEPIWAGLRIPTTFDAPEVLDQVLEISPGNIPGIEGADRTFAFSSVSMGNPHCVIYVDDVAAFPVERVGPLIETHPFFPRKVNEGGDAELICVLTDYSHRPQSTSGATVTSYRVDMLVSVRFIDKVKGDTLYKDDRVPGYGTYAVDKGETEETGKRLAVESLVKVILDNSVSGW
jgi:hypothetical protein